jgi:hypothetical protein
LFVKECSGSHFQASANPQVERLPPISEPRRNELEGDVGASGFGLDDLITMGRESVPQQTEIMPFDAFREPIQILLGDGTTPPSLFLMRENESACPDLVGEIVAQLRLTRYCFSPTDYPQ